MTNERSLNHLSPDFAISAGTQVVLQVSKQVLDSSEFKKPGHVGVVIKSPPNNELPYLVEFADGKKVEAMFVELALRRKEIDALMSDGVYDEKLLEHVIYRCQVGSKAFGLSTKDSDDDIRGIYLPKAKRHWSLYDLPGQLEKVNDQHDEVYWELEKFLRLALKANPNILETLWTPMIIMMTPIAQELREIRSCFLSRHIYKTYSGYVLSQFRKMKNAYEKTGEYKTKHAMHLIRLLLSGIGVLENGEIMIDVSSHRDQLMSVRNGQFTFEEVRNIAIDLEATFQKAFETTDLPEQPNIKRVNQFLVDARRSQL